MTKSVNSSKIVRLIDYLNVNEVGFLRLCNKAEEITNDIFSNKRTLFNPIYISDICLADCPYCGYRISNKEFKRKTLKPNETAQEANFLINRGVKNILLLAGDYKHGKYVEMLRENISTIKKAVFPDWLGIEVATLEIEQYKILKEAGAESVTVFQETYNRNRYNYLHTTPEFKGDFDYRYDAQERAIKAGFEEVGFGVLYGIGFWKEDTIAMAEHALSIQQKYPNVKLRFSFPRLQISVGQEESCRTEDVSEQDLLKAIVAIRLLFPEASIIITGCESVKFLTLAASIANILGFNGSTEVGGYTINKKGLKQFFLNTHESFFKIKSELKKYEFDQ